MSFVKALAQENKVLSLIEELRKAAFDDGFRTGYEFGTGEKTDDKKSSKEKVDMLERRIKEELDKILDLAAEERDIER